MSSPFCSGVINKLFNFKGLNLWLLGSGVGLELLLVTGLIIVSYLTLTGIPSNEAPEWFGVVIILAAFLGSLLIALGISSMAHDGRGPTYGLIFGMVGAVVLAVIFFPSDLQTGFLIAAVTLLGG
ncbi:MAG: hypothetical protein Q7U74_12210, partial [Saprospiraceae bacterium]|nr:hypothetical protein [Saprospiraceae bacterium]